MITPVAIVEDNAEVCENLRLLLDQSADFTCACACRNGESALRRIPAAAPVAVILDIQLPGMSGIDCLSALKRRMPALRILMFTVCSDSEHIFRALEAGADGYLLKSTPPADILGALRDLLAGAGPLSGAVSRKVIERFRRDTPPPFAAGAAGTLTQREREVIELLAVGRSSKEIAATLAISGETVNVHLKHIYQKLDVRSRVEAVIKYLGSPSGSPFAVAGSGR